MSETNTKTGSDSSPSGSADEADELAALRERIKGLQDEVAEADKRLRTLLHERPFASLAAAVVAGFVLGRIIGRS
jgi:ElaB/YqjD/DUF883 family membrane-anchored ribosome-binding protein